MLQRLADATLVVGRTVGIDATTLEAHAAMRSIVRRDTGESYDAFLTRLAEAVGAPGIVEVVADKGYHRNETMVGFAVIGVRSYVSEPDRGRRH